MTEPGFAIKLVSEDPTVPSQTVSTFATLAAGLAAARSMTDETAPPENLKFDAVEVWQASGRCRARLALSDRALRPRASELEEPSFRPVDEATLLFVIDGSRVLLIRKKRGLGAGKINAPGGRLERGETPLRGAVREVEEEVGVTPLAPEALGSLSFQFLDGYSIRARLFVARSHQGIPHETSEAVPAWFELDALPFGEMWADDILWVPHVLSGHSVTGFFVFDGDRMLDHRLFMAE